jgi:hypothetical protein
MQKADRKNIEISQIYGKNCACNPPCWFDPPYLAGFAKFHLRVFCGSKKLIAKSRLQKDLQNFK